MPADLYSDGCEIETLTLKAFRNYKDSSFEFDPSLTIFVGQNAIGKTNIIEALQILTAGESFRRPVWSDVVMWGQSASSISFHAHCGNRQIDTEAHIKNGQRVYKLNGKQKKIAEVKGVIPSVLFTPEDLGLIKDSADKRRNALDSFGGQMSSAYDSIKSDYEKVLKHRNALLKNNAGQSDVFVAWTEKLIEVGTAFYSYRKKIFSRLVPYIRNLYMTLSNGEELNAYYIPSWGDTDTDPIEAFRESLDKEMLREQMRQTTLVGPQRDEVVFMINGKNARQFGSQGQQRTIALAWKLAEIEVISDVLKRPPILLLDDVMSELDQTRRAALTTFVGNRVQTFITTTTTQYFDPKIVSQAKIITFEK